MAKKIRAYAASLLKKTAADNRALAAPIQVFGYQKPGGERKGSKEIVQLCKNRHLRGAIHVIRTGGEENLHSHKTIDGFWMVLTGRARFYGDKDTVIGEFGPLEGVLVPRNNRYWFESVGVEDLELLQVLVFEPGQGFDRDDHAAPNFAKSTVKWFDGRKSQE